MLECGDCSATSGAVGIVEFPLARFVLADANDRDELIYIIHMYLFISECVNIVYYHFITSLSMFVNKYLYVPHI